MVIVGGGVAGLWLRAAAWRAGRLPVLVSRGPLGAGQTVLSQGILHSGVKYAFSSAAAQASRELRAAGQAWAAALGDGPGGADIPDLRRVRVLARIMHLWTTESFLSQFTASVAASVMKSGVRRLERGEHPSAFAGAPRGVSVWEVSERSVDAASLIGELAADCPAPIIGSGGAAPSVKADGVAISGPGGPITLGAPCVVFSAGAGNETLLAENGIDPGDICQRRPLHMVYAAGAPTPLFGHCIARLSDKPRLTVTTGTDGQGRAVWYAGGELAESGTGRSDAEQHAVAAREITECLPWLDTQSLRWQSVRIDRAEGKTPDGRRPDGPILRRVGHVIACWPTKLALAPVLAAQVLADTPAGSSTLAHREERCGRMAEQLRALGFRAPAIAQPPWIDDPSAGSIASDGGDHGATR